MMAWTISIFGGLQRATEFLSCPAIIGKLTILPHGKSGFADRISLRKKLWIFGIAFIKRNDALAHIKFLDLIVDIFDIITFVSNESAFCNRKKRGCICKNIESDRRIMNFCSCGYFINRQAGDTINKNMIFVPLVEFVFFLICLIGSSMNTKLTVMISFGLIVRFKFVGQKGFGIIL